MSNRNLSIFNKLRPVSVGFDSVFDHFESMFNDDFFNLSPAFTSTYPPYNITKSGENKYDVELALAGFNKNDVSVSVHEGLLTIETKDSGDKSGSEAELIHQGISKRYFKKVFTLSNDVEVRSAELKDGLLRISMERVIPDEMKRKEIEIV